MNKTTFALALALLLSPAWAQKPPAAAKAATTKATAPAAASRQAPLSLLRELGGIEEYRLPNGLQVLLLPDATQSTTTVNITYRVGSRHEVPGEYGMAHLLEHMLFKGTTRQRDIPGEMAKRGVRFNGTTTVDRTNYFASFNANADTLAFLIDLEADRMVNSRVAKEDLDKEMTVVRNEFERGENQPFQVLVQRVNSVAYSWHPYGKAPIGPKSDIENVPIEKLQAFYKRFYRPDNATLLVAGNFDKAATLALVQRHMGPIAQPATPLPRPYTVEPPQDGERSVTVRRVGGQPIVLASYKVPAISHPDTAPLIVYQLMLSLQPSGQLYKQLVEPKLAAAAAVSGVGQADPGQTSAFLVLPADADVAKLESQLLDIVEGRTLQPFTEAELARVREAAVNRYRQQMKNPEALIQQISGLIAAGDWRLLFQLMEDIPKVTLADVDRVRKAYFRPSNRTVGRYLPATAVERVEIPAAPSLEQRLAGLQGPPKVDAGELLDPTPAVLETRTTRSTLPSGITLHTLAKQTRGNTVSMLIEARWGERSATHARPGSAMVGRLLMEGSRTRSKQQVQDELIQLRASLNVVSAEQGLSVRLSAERDTLLPALALVADLMRNPLLPADAFEREVKNTLSNLEAQRQEPETLSTEATRGHYNRTRGVALGHPDYMMGLDERIADMQRMTLTDVTGFHADYWSANRMTVLAAGTLPDALGTEVERLFGSWKKPQAPAFVRHEAQHLAVPPARFDAIAKDKANAIVGLRQPIALSQRDADHIPLMVAVHIFGSGSLESRLNERLRQKDGLTYGISASLLAPFFGNQASLAINGSFAPANRERLISGVQEEIRRMGEQGITAAELARAQRDLLERNKQARAQTAVLARTLGRLAEQRETWAREQERDAAIAAVTVDSANAAWKRHILANGFVISTAGDFK